MLITFSCTASANITMLEDTARTLLGLMGQNSNVPGALLAKDIPAALAQLEANTAQNKHPPASDSTEGQHDDEPPVPLANQAFPMIQLLRAAAKEECDLLWDTSSKLDTGV